MNPIRALLLACRPKTLTAALVPILVIWGLNKAENAVMQHWIFILALLASIFIQIGTNFVNDASDFKKGADTEERLGPLRVTQAGYLSYQQMMAAAGVAFLIAIGFGVPLVIEGGTVILIVGVLSLFFAYGYTAGPFPLAYLGLGDLFVVLFFGFVACMGLNYLNTKIFTVSSFIIGFQVGLHCAVLIAINNLRDVFQDLKAEKKTMAVRLGIEGARAEIFILIWLPFILQLFWFLKGYTLAFYLPFLMVPLAILLTKNVFKNEPGRIYNKFLGQAAGLHLGFGICLSLGLSLI